MQTVMGIKFKFNKTNMDQTKSSQIKKLQFKVPEVLFHLDAKCLCSARPRQSATQNYPPLPWGLDLMI